MCKCAGLITEETRHVCKHESKAYLKAKHTNIQKPYVFADPMNIFSENGSIFYINENIPFKTVNVEGHLDGNEVSLIQLSIKSQKWFCIGL